MQAARPDDHAGDQLAQDRGQLPTHQQLRQQAGGHKNHQEAAYPKQGFSHLELVCTDLGHQTRGQLRTRVSPRRAMPCDNGYVPPRA